MPCTCEAKIKGLPNGHISCDTLLELLRRTFKGRPEKQDITCPDAHGMGALSYEVDRIDEDIAYADFFVKYLFGNQPCIIGKWITRDWKVTSEWVSNCGTGNSEINFSKLVSLFGDAKVPVADCSNRYYNSQCKVEMLFSDYVSYLKKNSRGEHSTDQCLYLKDWHFYRQFPEYQAYTTPKYFTSDWLNFTSDLNTCDDYRFVYIGPKDSWTPFHADVYRSFSWSANVCGKKRWLLFPPGEESKMKDKMGNLPYDVTNISYTEKNINFIDVVQEEGEIIFVPSGWYHQVHNIEDTISINHNWLNGASISRVTQFLSSQAALVRTEIEDCKAVMALDEWNSQCELILKADSGMNIHDFVKFLDIIACDRSAFLYHTTPIFFEVSKAENNFSIRVLFDMINIIKTKIEIYQSPKGDAIVAYPHNHENISFCDELNHGNSDLCYQHAIFDLCMLLGAVDSIRIVCDEINARDLLFQLDRICATVQRFFLYFECKVEELNLSINASA